MHSRARHCILAFGCAALLSVASAEETPDVAPAASTCPSGTGLITLVGQKALLLDRPASNADQGSVRWRNAVSAMTGLIGSGVMMLIYGGYDPGRNFAAPPETDEALQPEALAQALARAVTATAPAARDLLLATSDAALVDATLKETTCEQTDVLSTYYGLTAGNRQVQLSMITQVFRIMRDAPRETRFVLESRSAPVPLAPSKKNVEMAAAFDIYLRDHGTELAADIRAAALDTAQMLARLEAPPAAVTPPATLRKAALKLSCTDCKPDDLVLAETPTRAWIQPANTPQALRSLPRR